MKNVTKLLLVLLTLALMLSCVCVFASAEAVTEENLDDVLEYFEKSIDFNLDGKYADDASALAALQKALGETNSAKLTAAVASDEYVSLVTSSNGECYFKANIVAGDRYVLEARFHVQGSTPRMRSSVKVCYETKDGFVESITGDIDFSTENSDKWLTVRAEFLPKEEGYTVNYTLSNSEDLEKPVVFITEVKELEEAPATVYFACSSTGKDSAKNRAKIQTDLDYIKMYSGSDRVLDNVVSVIDSKLVDLIGYYDTEEDSAKKLAALEVINKVTSAAGYAYQPTSEAAQNAAARAATEIVSFYSKSLVTLVGEIDTAAAYKDRVAKVESIAIYDAAISAEYNGEDAEAVLGAKAAYKTEVDALAELKNQSEGYLNAINPLASLVFPYSEGETVYNDIAKYLASKTFADLETLYKDVTKYAPCDTFEGVAETADVKNALVADYDARVAKAKSFLSNIATVANEELSFGERYTAFLLAEENKFEDETYEGITAALAAFDLFNDYQQSIVENAKAFIKAVDNAATSTYYSSKIDYLDAAAALLDTVDFTYPGAEDAKTKYNSLKATLDEQAKVVKAYLEAVDAIKDDMSFMDKKAAVDAALALQATGAINGFNGVSEANIKLSAAESQIKTPEGYSTCFIEYVKLAKDAANLLDRRVNIQNAKAILDKVEDNYEGVTAAKVALAETINAYNKAVAEANTAFTETANRAVETVSAAAPADCVKQIVAILKKIFVD